MPDDIRVDSLNNQQMDDLNRLKEWLYKRRVAARKEGEVNLRRRHKDDEADKLKAERPALFEF